MGIVLENGQLVCSGQSEGNSSRFSQLFYSVVLFLQYTLLVPAASMHWSLDRNSSTSLPLPSSCGSATLYNTGFAIHHITIGRILLFCTGKRRYKWMGWTKDFIIRLLQYCFPPSSYDCNSPAPPNPSWMMDHGSCMDDGGWLLRLLYWRKYNNAVGGVETAAGRRFPSRESWRVRPVRQSDKSSESERGR